MNNTRTKSQLYCFLCYDKVMQHSSHNVMPNNPYTMGRVPICSDKELI